MIVRNEYTATASQTVFNYTFLIFTNQDLNVFITPSGQEANDSTDLTTAYTVDVGTIGNPGGGFITFDSGVSAGDLVTIVSSIVEDRTTDYQNSGDFLPDTVNNDFDRVVSIAKQTSDEAARTLVFQQSLQNASSLILPNPSATQFLRWRSDETGMENVDLATGGTPTGSDLITYNAGNNFTNGVNRTQENKNGELISVKDFGAVGNGAANESTAFLNASGVSNFLFVPAGIYNVASGDFTGVYFFSFGGATITNNTTVIIIDLAVGNGRDLTTGDDLDTIGKDGFQVFNFDNSVSNIPAFGDGTVLHMQSTEQAAQLAFFGDLGIGYRNDDSFPFDFVGVSWNKLLVETGFITDFTIEDEIRFQGDRGSTGKIQKNNSTDRDEMQIYSAGDAFSANSVGSGIHLYGNRDKEHAGNFAVLTGQDDSGTARMIISGGSQSIEVTSITRSGSTATLTTAVDHDIDSTWLLTVRGANQSEYNVTLSAIVVTGVATLTYTVSGTPVTATGTITAHPGEGARTNTDTRITIGNSIFDFVDNSEDTAMLNLKNPQNRPAICFTETNSTTEGELTVPTGDEFSIGHWETTTEVFTPRVGMDAGGDWISFTDNGVGLGDSNNRWVDVWAVDGAINTSDEREKQQINAIPDAVLDAWANVNYMQYKWNHAVTDKGDDARLHIGVIAQHIKAAFENEGLDAFAYGFLGYDEFEGGNRYSIRPTECLMLEAALMRRELNKLKE